MKSANATYHSPALWDCQSTTSAYFVNLTAKQLYFRLARIEDALRFVDRRRNQISWPMSRTSAVLRRMRCWNAGPAFEYYLRGMGVHPARRIPKILDLVMEPCIERLS